MKHEKNLENFLVHQKSQSDFFVQKKSKIFEFHKNTRGFL